MKAHDAFLEYKNEKCYEGVEVVDYSEVLARSTLLSRPAENEMSQRP